jgi:hypothetical protein
MVGDTSSHWSMCGSEEKNSFFFRESNAGHPFTLLMELPCSTSCLAVFGRKTAKGVTILQNERGLLLVHCQRVFYTSLENKIVLQSSINNLLFLRGWTTPSELRKYVDVRCITRQLKTIAAYTLLSVRSWLREINLWLVNIKLPFKIFNFLIFSPQYKTLPITICTYISVEWLWFYFWLSSPLW